MLIHSYRHESSSHILAHTAHRTTHPCSDVTDPILSENDGVLPFDSICVSFCLHSVTNISSNEAEGNINFDIFDNSFQRERHTNTSANVYQTRFMRLLLP